MTGNKRCLHCDPGAGSRRLLTVVAAVVLAVLCPVSASAGGPRWYAGPPFFNANWTSPVVFYTDTPLYFTDPGDLNANVTHAQADAMVAAAAAVWNAPTSALTLAQGGTLAEHVSSANVYVNGGTLSMPADIQPGNYQSIQIAVLYDTDGSVIDTLLGTGASAPSGCRQNGVVDTVDGFDPNAATIQHALLILNGRCVGSNADQLKQMQYQLARKFGRVLGVAWSQLNDDVFTGTPTPNALELSYWPLMHPIDVLCSAYTYKCMTNPFTLRADDLAALAEMYPVTGSTVPAGKILTATDALQFVNIVDFPTSQGMGAVNLTARRSLAGGQHWETAEIVSGLSGNLYQQVAGNPVTGPAVGEAQSSGAPYSSLEGLMHMWRIPMLDTGIGIMGLQIASEPVNPLYTGDYALAPYLGPVPAPSGAAIGYLNPYVCAGFFLGQTSVADGAAGTCNPGADGTETAPVAVDPSGWCSGQLCGDGHVSWGALNVKAGRSWAVEVTALDETGAASMSKLHPLIGLWSANDPTGTLPTMAATPAPFNALSAGMTELHIAAAGAAQSIRFAIADDRGRGRPDYTYNARVLYADSVSPAVVSGAGGSVTITGMGFRTGNRVTVNGVAATVSSWTADTIVAVLPSRVAALAAAGTALDVAVIDSATGGSSIMSGIVSYDSTAAPDLVTLVSAPAKLTVGTAASTPFAVRVLLADGVTAAAGASVRLQFSSGAGTFAACAGTACTLVADANGRVSTTVTAAAAGTLTVMATEVSGGGSVSASAQVVPAPDLIALVSAPVSAETGLLSAAPVSVRVTLADGSTAVSGASVRFTVSSGSAALAACAASSCTVVTDANGLAVTSFTPAAAGSLTISATELSGGASVSAVIQVSNPVRAVTTTNGTRYLAAGANSSWTFAVHATQDGAAAAGVPVAWSSSGPAVALGAASAATDANGNASVTVSATALPAGTLVVQGCAWTTACATASVTGVAAAQWVLTVASGSGQSISASATFAPVVLSVTDGASHALEGAPVNVYQTVDAWEGACPAQGRCPAAAVLAKSQTAAVSGADGSVAVTPLQLSATPSVTNIAASSGTQGFVSLALTKTP